MIIHKTYSPEQRLFIESVAKYGIDTAQEMLASVRDGRDLIYSHPLKLNFKNDAIRVEIYEADSGRCVADSDMSDNVFFFANYMTDTAYRAVSDSGEVLDFSTEPALFRFITVDGVRNVRDLGGGAIRRGILYRGSALNGDFTVSADGVRVARETLGIRTELDLRKECVGVYDSSALGDDVAYYLIPYRPYSEVFLSEYRAAIVEIFKLFADESLYPIYFHCMGGADRTGMLAIYLRALAGDSEEDILLDYELTSLATVPGPDGSDEGVIRSRRGEYFLRFLDTLSTYAPDGTFRDRIIAFLLDCGITQDTLDRIATIIRK